MEATTELIVFSCCYDPDDHALSNYSESQRCHLPIAYKRSGFGAHRSPGSILQFSSYICGGKLSERLLRVSPFFKIAKKNFT
jgi:hypothetical protein